MRRNPYLPLCVALLLLSVFAVEPAKARRAITITEEICSAVTTNGTDYTSGAFTPADQDLLVALVGITGTTDTAPTYVDGQFGAWTLARTGTKATSADRNYIVVRNTLASAASHDFQITVGADAGTGGVVCIMAIAGMSKAGADAVVQVAGEDNQTAATPAPAFGASANTNNPTLGLIHNATNPAGITFPTNWTEDEDTGHANPTTGFETVSRVSGFSGTTITWGGASASAFASAIIELDASAAPAGTTKRLLLLGIGKPE